MWPYLTGPDVSSCLKTFRRMDFGKLGLMWNLLLSPIFGLEVSNIYLCRVERDSEKWGSFPTFSWRPLEMDPTECRTQQGLLKPTPGSELRGRLASIASKVPIFAISLYWDLPFQET